MIRSVLDASDTPPTMTKGLPMSRFLSGLTLGALLTLSVPALAQEAAGPPAPPKPQPKPTQAKPAKPARTAKVVKLDAGVLFLPGEAEGDKAKSLDALMKTIAADPNGPMVQLGVRRLPNMLAAVKDGRARVAAWLATVLTDPRLTAGENRDRLEDLMVDLLRAAGEADAALALQKGRGYLTSWRQIGPFGYARRSGLELPTPVERDLARESVDLEKTYEGQDKPVSWTEVGRDASRWALRQSLSPQSRAGGGLVYGLAAIKLEEDLAEGFLEFEGSSARIFVNRVLIGHIHRAELEHPRRVRFPVSLVKGWNRVVVKMTGGSGVFELRLVDKSGTAVPFESAGLDVELPKAPLGTAPASLAPQRLLTDLALDAAVKDPKAIAMRMLRAVWMSSEQGLGEQALSEVEALLEDEVAAQQPWLRLYAGPSFETANHLDRSQRVPRARGEYEAALKLAGGPMQPATQRLARIEAGADKIVEAVTRLEEALEACPKDLEIGLELYRMLLGQNWRGEADELLAQLFKTHGELEILLEQRARRFRRMGRVEQADAIAMRLFKADKRRSYALSSMRRRALRLGELDEARALLERQRKLEPGREKAWLSAEIELAQAAGELEKELELRGKLCAMDPDNFAAQEEMIRRAVAATSAAAPTTAQGLVNMLEQLLKRDPSRFSARSLLDALKGQDEDFWSPWDVSNEDLLTMKVDTSDFPNASTICLLDQEITRLYPDGSSEKMIHQAFRIVDQRGVEQMGQFPEAGRTMEICTLWPDGTRIEPIRTSGGGFQMPGLKPGAVVVHKYVTRSGGDTFQFNYGPWFFQDPSLQKPYALTRWVLIAPKTTPFEILERNLDFQVKVEETGELVTRVWEARKQPRIEPEPNMPGRDEILPQVELLQKRTFEDMLPFYRDRTYTPSFVTPAIQQATDEVIKGVKGDRARAEKLYRFVKDTIKGGGWGRTAGAVLASRRGSHGLLFRALLKAADIPFDEAIAGLAPGLDDTDWLHPRPGQLQNALIRVRPKDGEAFWTTVEGARYAPMDLLPEYLWGAPVLIFSEEGEELTVLPEGDPNDTGTSSTMTVKLDKDGAAAITLVSATKNSRAWGIKEKIPQLSRMQLQGFLQQQAGSRFPGSRLTAWDFPKVEDPTVPFTTSIAVSAPEYVRDRDDGRLTIPSGVAGANLAQALGGRPTRKFDLLLRGWIVAVDSIEIDPGPYSVAALPPGVFLKQAWGSYSLSFKRSGRKIRVERRLRLVPSRTKAKDYPAFLNFLRRVDAADAARIELTR